MRYLRRPLRLPSALPPIGGLGFLLAALFLLGLAAPALAQEKGPGAASTPAPELSREEIEAFEDVDVPAFARVREAAGGLRVIREDGYEEDLSRNAPLYVGDTVKTTAEQRAELQFPFGELLRIDRASEVEIYAISDPADPDSDRSTLVGLARGSLQASVSDPRGGEGYRVDTPSASVYPLLASRFRVDVELGGDVRVSVERGRVEVAGESGSRVLETGERVRIRAGQGPGRPYRYNVMVGDSFDDWVLSRDESYELARAPGPEYEELPDEVRPYYSELSANGEWVETEEYGWVWNPETDDDWRPYYDGEWADGPWGPVWVSDVSWSWPVYRYGRWEYTAFGWSWIPGRVFRPAHVYWYYGPDYVGWCPIGYYDTPVYIGSHFSFSVGFHWGHTWFDYHPWTFVHHNHFYHHHARHVYVDRHRVVGRHLDRGYVTRRGVVGGRSHRDTAGVRARSAGSRALYDDYSRGGRRGARRADTLRGERQRDVAQGAEGRARVSGGRSFRDVEQRTLRARAERFEDGQRRSGARAGRSSSSGVSRRDSSSGTRTRGGSSRSVGTRGGSRGGDSKAGSTRGRGGTPNAADRPLIRIRRPDQGSGAAAREEGSSTTRRRDEGAQAAAPRRSRREGAATRPARSTRSFERRTEGRASGVRQGSARTRSGSEDGVKRFLGRIGESSRAPERAKRSTERGSRARNEGSARSSGGSSPRPSVEGRSRGRGGSTPSVRTPPSRGSSRGSVGSKPRSVKPKSPSRSRGSVGSRSTSGGSKSSGRSRGSVGSRSTGGGSKSSGRSRGSVGSRSTSGGSKSSGRSRGSVGSRSTSGGSKSSGRSRGSVGSRSTSGGSKSSGRSRGGGRSSRSKGKRR